MKTTQLGQFLIQLTRLWAFNCFLVREANGFTLIDTNLPGSATAILQAAQQLGMPITRIALTHSHQDHAASLDALHLALPQAEIAFPAREARFLAGDLSLDPAEPQAKLRGGYITVTTQPTRLLQPGDRLGSLEVIPAPGHTPGHIAFLDTRDRSLIAGDAFQTQFGIAVSGTLKWLFPFPALATWHKPTALQSARALRALNPARLAVGHGPALENPQAGMDAAILAAARQLE